LARFPSSPNFMLRFSQAEKQIGVRLYKKLINEKKNPKAPFMSFDDLYGFLDREEKKLIDKICSVEPKEYGKNFTIFYGIKPVPKDLVTIVNQVYFSVKDKKVKKVKTQYLPRPVFVAFAKMKKAMAAIFGLTISRATR